MKTFLPLGGNKMKNKVFFAGILSMALVFGLVLVGCDFGEGSTGGSSTGGSNTGGGSTTDTTKAVYLTSGTYVCTYNGTAYKCTVSASSGGKGFLTIVSAPAGHILPGVNVYSYTITGSDMVVTGSQTYSYTVSSTTSFSGYGETWVKTAN
jgi:hypothetical protein